MLSHITGKLKREEAMTSSTSFDILVWIRSRRLRWVGHILRLDDERLIKQTLKVKVIYDNRQTGDILMDVDDMSWEDLRQTTADRDVWRAKVNVLRQAAAAQRVIYKKKKKK